MPPKTKILEPDFDIFGQYNDTSKTLCEILTAADGMPLPIAGSRVDDSLPRHGSVRPSLQRGGGRAWGRSFGVLDPTHG